MGITRTARDAFKADLATFKATNPTRAQLRKFAAAVVDAGNEWLSKFDAQEVAAPTDFAASKQAQYATFVAGIADPTIADRDDVP